MTKSKPLIKSFNVDPNEWPEFERLVKESGLSLSAVLRLLIKAVNQGLLTLDGSNNMLGILNSLYLRENGEVLQTPTPATTPTPEPKATPKVKATTAPKVKAAPKVEPASTPEPEAEPKAASPVTTPTIEDIPEIFFVEAPSKPKLEIINKAAEQTAKAKKEKATPAKAATPELDIPDFDNLFQRPEPTPTAKPTSMGGPEFADEASEAKKPSVETFKTTFSIDDILSECEQKSLGLVKSEAATLSSDASPKTQTLQYTATVALDIPTNGDINIPVSETTLALRNLKEVLEHVGTPTQNETVEKLLGEVLPNPDQELPDGLESLFDKVLHTTRARGLN